MAWPKVRRSRRLKPPPGHQGTCGIARSCCPRPRDARAPLGRSGLLRPTASGTAEARTKRLKQRCRSTPGCDDPWCVSCPLSATDETDPTCLLSPMVSGTTQAMFASCRRGGRGRLTSDRQAGGEIGAGESDPRSPPNQHGLRDSMPISVSRNPSSVHTSPRGHHPDSDRKVQWLDPRLLRCNRSGQPGRSP